MPVMHLITVQMMEKYIENKYTEEIEGIYTGDTQPLFNGDIRLRDAINNNIENYLRKRFLISLGAKVDVMVTTRQNIILYPAALESDADVLNPPSRKQVATENYKLMNEGLSISVDILLERSSILVISIFIVYALLASLVFLRFYIVGSKKAVIEEIERKIEIERLQRLGGQHIDRLKILNQEKTNLASNIQKIKQNLEEYKLKTVKNEDEMINEMILLEEKMQQNIDLREELQSENEAIKEVTRRYEKEKLKSGKKSAAYGNVTKRFKALYKNLSVNNKAVDGFINLIDDMKIKAEEIIHQMDRDPAHVQVKRKVSLYKSDETVFEIVFAYGGRLYFRNSKDHKIEIMTIGTKNTQTKDIAFLETL
ncbi:MAG: hypothetical protein JRI91_14065 [Deltaproteobacteria bacterium]|nr:hypothetical protein [Deltaproteobacteria bacterium]